MVEIKYPKYVFFYLSTRRKHKVQAYKNYAQYPYNHNYNLRSNCISISNKNELNVKQLQKKQH